ANVTPNVTAPQNVTSQPTPPVNVTTPPTTNVTPQPTPTPTTLPEETITLEDISEIAKTDPAKALAACDTMPDTDKTGCVSRVAVATKDETVCGRLGTPYDRDKCYVSVASAGRTQACASVQDEALRATCEAVSKFYAPSGGSS
ncbi:MAG: hypothetical protein AABY13_05215, partial [Nanoarchaeota archaeon]